MWQRRDSPSFDLHSCSPVANHRAQGKQSWFGVGGLASEGAASFTSSARVLPQELSRRGLWKDAPKNAQATFVARVRKLIDDKSSIPVACPELPQLEAVRVAVCVCVCVWLCGCAV